MTITNGFKKFMDGMNKQEVKHTVKIKERQHGQHQKLKKHQTWWTVAVCRYHSGTIISARVTVQQNNGI